MISVYKLFVVIWVTVSVYAICIDKTTETMYGIGFAILFQLLAIEERIDKGSDNNDAKM